MSEENYREIIVDVEPRNKEFRVAVMKDTSVEEVISTLIRRCEDEGIRVSDWGRSKVGQSNVSFVLMRKSTGNTAIAPTVSFGELFPELEDRETFKLDARAQVGWTLADKKINFSFFQNFFTISTLWVILIIQF